MPTSLASRRISPADRGPSASAARSHSRASARRVCEATPEADSRSNWSAVHWLSPSQTTRATSLPGEESRRNASEGGGRPRLSLIETRIRRSGIVGIGGEEEPAAGGANDANGAETAIEGIGGHRFVEMADGDDCHPGALGEAFQRVKGTAHSLIGILVVTAGEKGDQRVDDQERGLGAGDDFLEDIDMIGDGSKRPGRVVIGQGRERDNAAGVATSGVDAGTDGVVGVVLGGHEDDRPRRSRFTAGERIAAGDASGELAEEGALAETRIAVEDGDLAGREPTGGEPAYWLGSDLTERDDGRERFTP